jgi:DNA helicase-2/ATP-dependent DNA helicase PcrA
VSDITLTSEQLKIINLSYGEHLVLAPPGTGKTELLTQRVLKAINSANIPQNRMACLTFTNRAAKNMIDRIEQEIGSSDVFVGNIHNFCNSFLRKNHIIAYGVSLLDEEDSSLLMDDIYDDFVANNNSVQVYDKYKKEPIRDISKGELLAVNSFINQKELAFPKEITKTPKVKFLDEVSKENAYRICKEYERVKKESNFIDFDDLLILTYSFFKDYKGDLNEFQFDWIQIDEVQDLNPLQWAIVHKISAKDAYRVYFGDYEQAIFSFLGAKIEMLDKIASRSNVYYLSKNFRSPKYLLELFNKYASCWLHPKWSNKPVSDKDIKKDKNSLLLREIRGSEMDEVKWIVEKKLPKEPKDTTAIIVKKNSSADLFAKALDKKRLRYFKISGFDLFSREIIKDMMAFLNIIINEDDRNSWIRVIRRFGKVKTLKSSRQLINSMFEIGLNPFDLIDDKYQPSYIDSFLKHFKQGRVVVFDTETTGLDTSSDDIIQIAAIKIENAQVVERFEVYINTDKDLSDSIRVHNISKEFLEKNGIDKKEALDSFLDFIKDASILAHNLEYDLMILNSNLERCGLKPIDSDISKYDSIKLTKRVYPRLKHYKLEFLLKELEIEGENSHNAMDDVVATKNLLFHLSDKIESKDKKREEFLQNNARVVKRFKDNFRDLYDAVSGRFSDDLSMQDIVEMIVTYMIDTLKMRVEESIYDEIDKLLKHMEYNCKIDKAITNIKRYVPEYAKYKEADLITGKEKIIIASVHKAKGLEFENVVVVGVNEENYPGYFSKIDGKEAIDEEARVLYVAMSRAKRRLLITFYTQSQFSKDRLKLSRFLEPVKEMFDYKITQAIKN